MTYSNVFFLSFSLLLSSTIHSMDIVQHQPDDVQKRALTALMFTGALQAPLALKKHNPILLHHDGDFHLIQKGKLSKIPFENMRGFKKKLSKDQFKGFLKNGGYLWLSKNDQDDYFVEAKMRGLGGGIGGANAGFWAGKFLTYLVVHGAIAIVTVPVSIVNPIAGAALHGSIYSTISIPVEAVSNTVGLAAGLAGGVATGFI